jgi:hypothetical protein
MGFLPVILMGDNSCMYIAIYMYPLRFRALTPTRDNPKLWDYLTGILKKAKNEIIPQKAGSWDYLFVCFFALDTFPADFGVALSRYSYSPK